MSWDGYLSYDGVLYGLPSEPPLAGTVVQVREQRGVLSVWSRGQSLVNLVKRPRSQDIVDHPDQFRTVATANASRQAVVPLGHQRSAPQVAQRPLLAAGHSALFTTLSQLAESLETASHPDLMRQRLRRYPS